MLRLVPAVLEPEVVEVVGETSKSPVGIHPFVTGRGVGVGDVLESAFDIEREVVCDEKLQATRKLRGELPIATDRILVRPVPSVGVDNAGSALNIRNNDPSRLDKVVADEASDSDHVGSKAVPDIRSGGFEDGFEISPEGTIEIGARAPRVGGVEHPTEADVVLLVVENRSGRT